MRGSLWSARRSTGGKTTPVGPKCDASICTGDVGGGWRIKLRAGPPPGSGLAAGTALATPAGAGSGGTQQPTRRVRRTQSRILGCSWQVFLYVLLLAASGPLGTRAWMSHVLVGHTCQAVGSGTQVFRACSTTRNLLTKPGTADTAPAKVR